MKISKALWTGLKRKLQMIGFGITERTIKVVDIPESEGKLGYTSKGGAIHIAPYHPLMDGLSEVETVAFIKGVYAHELMHQIETDFNAFNSLHDTLPKYENKIFASIFNILEDPSIENQSCKYFGGHLLSSLHYTVSYIYQKSEDIDKDSDPFGQFCQAYIQYGDGGFLKGDFSSEEAREVFVETLPIFDAAICEPDGAKRVVYAYDIFNRTRPLWESEVEDARQAEEFMKQLADSLEKLGKSLEPASGGGMSVPYIEDSTDEEIEKKSKGRSYTKSLLEEALKDSLEDKETRRKNGADSEKNEIPDNSTSSKDSSENETDKNSSEKSKESSASSENTSKSESEDEDTMKSDDSESSSNSTENFQSKNESSSSDNSVIHPDEPDELDGIGEVVYEEYDLTSEDISSVKDEISELKKEAALEKIADKESQSDVVDFPEMKVHYKGASCKNVLVKSTPDECASVYDTLLSPMLSGITLLTNQLKRIFKNDTDDKEHRSTGRLNMKRLSSGQLTTRVFDRRRAPINKSDCCIVLLIDESGSMAGRKSHCAKQTAIGLSEVFARLKIPVSVIGFTADTGGYDVVQYHYLHWKNNRADRLKLLNIKDRCNNFDGYSIRYAAEMLKRRKERHKLLIVISDGQPACRYYHYTTGIADTVQAIREASKIADVLGVAIDNSAVDVLYSMYKEHFLQCKNVNDLFNKLGATIKNRIKRWE